MRSQTDIAQMRANSTDDRVSIARRGRCMKDVSNGGMCGRRGDDADDASRKVVASALSPTKPDAVECCLHSAAAKRGPTSTDCKTGNLRQASVRSALLLRALPKQLPMRASLPSAARRSELPLRAVARAVAHLLRRREQAIMRCPPIRLQPSSETSDAPAPCPLSASPSRTCSPVPGRPCRSPTPARGRHRVRELIDPIDQFAMPAALSQEVARARLGIGRLADHRVLCAAQRVAWEEG